MWPGGRVALCCCCYERYLCTSVRAGRPDVVAGWDGRRRSGAGPGDDAGRSSDEGVVGRKQGCCLRTPLLGFGGWMPCAIIITSTAPADGQTCGNFDGLEASCQCCGDMKAVVSGLLVIFGNVNVRHSRICKGRHRGSVLCRCRACASKAKGNCRFGQSDQERLSQTPGTHVGPARLGCGARPPCVSQAPTRSFFSSQSLCCPQHTSRAAPQHPQRLAWPDRVAQQRLAARPPG